MKTIDIETWKRADQFRYYKDYHKPWFNITADVDVTTTLATCRREGLSFFLVTLFNALKTVNDIEAFRYRIRGDAVIVHEVVQGGATVLNDDQTFGFCDFRYDPDPAVFLPRAAERLQRYHGQERKFTPADRRDDLIYVSVIPWVAFTSFSHAHHATDQKSIPRLVIGKYREVAGAWQMPVSVEVHHALMDGWHVGQFFQGFAEANRTPPSSPSRPHEA